MLERSHLRRWDRTKAMYTGVLVQSSPPDGPHSGAEGYLRGSDAVGSPKWHMIYTITRDNIRSGPLLGPLSQNSADWLPSEVLIQKEMILDKDGKGCAHTGKVKCSIFSHSTKRIQLYKKAGHRGP